MSNKIKIHSQTDLITNSSTTIYTISDDSPKALEQLVNEFFKVTGLELKCKDVFTFKVEKDRSLFWDMISDDVDDDNEEIPADLRSRDYNVATKAWKKFQEDIESKTIKKPGWFKEYENNFDQGEYTSSSSYLVITPKDKKYEKLAGLLVKFLYSTEAVEGSDC